MGLFDSWRRKKKSTIVPQLKEPEKLKVEQVRKADSDTEVESEDVVVLVAEVDRQLSPVRDRNRCRTRHKGSQRTRCKHPFHRYPLLCRVSLCFRCRLPAGPAASRANA